MKLKSQFYEVLDVITDDTENMKLQAVFTPNNGIRIQIANADLEDGYWSVFDFTVDQAEFIGQALVRWAQRRRAEIEQMRIK